MYRAIVVDDEEPAREELITLIKEGSDIDVIGEAINGISAIRLIAEKKPDLVFLDIQMPGIDGLEVAREIIDMDNPPLIVFVTAYDEHALKAFEVSAIDYILKPAHPKRIKKTLERIESILFNRKDGDKNINDFLKFIPEPVKLTRIIAQKEGRDSRILVDLTDISHFYARGRDCYLVTHGEEMKIRYTLKEIEDKVPGESFIRCHKAYLVNIKYIKEIVPWFNGAYIIKVEDKSNSEIPVSRNYAKEFKDAIGWI